MADRSLSQHMRYPSFHVIYSPQDVAQLAQELKDGKISDVHLSLFTYWICEKQHNYEQARQHIRELGLDQGYPTNRLRNIPLRKLLDETLPLRPSTPSFLYDLKNPVLPRQGRGRSATTQSAPNPSNLDVAIHRKRIQQHGFPTLSPALSEPTPISFRPYTSIAGPPHSKPRQTAPDSPTPLMPTTNGEQDIPTDVLMVALGSISSTGDSQDLNSPSSSLSEFPLPPGYTHWAMPESTAPLTPWKGAVPPDTPDRPAPLNIRFRTSSAAAKMQGNNLNRSMSTPTRMQKAPHYCSSPATVSSRVDPRSSSLDEAMGDINQGDGYTSRRATRESYVISGTVLIPAMEPVAEGHASVSIRNAGDVQTEASTSSGNIASATPSSPHAGISSRKYADKQSLASSSTPQQIPVNKHGRVFGFVPGPAPTSEQRFEAVQARRQAQLLGAPVHSINRSLPQRSFSLHSHNVSRSSDSGSPRNRHSLYASDSHRRQLPRGTLTSLSSSIEPSALARAPTPSLMSMSALQVSESTDAQKPTSEYITAWIQQARARTDTSATVDRASLSAFERAWRDDNEALIIAIFSRSAVPLGEEDVELVGHIGRELKNGVGRISGYEWTRELFC
ncbi:hypothetical protein BCR34DRAFT_556837 [Clohesyomyces aquaticus]|uniref:Uncharacterized protein n=1 Tax=Clohesyomyces aquaticus TaxID=1231657 RepID=A0A1Y2A210_9PLEO|nr:hypothetical protein BCR34DRAFT_556837 [Clohesyomyces aquaticus]